MNLNRVTGSWQSRKLATLISSVLYAGSEMEFLIYILVVTMLSIICGEISHLSSIGKIKKIRRNFIKHPSVSLVSYLIWGCSIGIVLVNGIGAPFSSNLESYFIINQTLIFIILISVVFLGVYRYKLIAFVERWWKIIVSCMSAFAVVFSMYVSVYVDTEIFKYSQFNAKHFPNAQNLIFIYLVPLFAILLSFYCFTLMYFLHAANILLRHLMNILYLQRLLVNIVFIISGKKRRVVRELDSVADMGVLIGLALLTITLPILLKVLVSEKQLNIDKAILDTLIFTSYYPNSGSVCSNIKDEKLLIAFIKNDQLSIAKALDNGNYEFFTSNCIRGNRYSTDAVGR